MNVYRGSRYWFIKAGPKRQKSRSGFNYISIV